MESVWETRSGLFVVLEDLSTLMGTELRNLKNRPQANWIVFHVGHACGYVHISVGALGTRDIGFPQELELKAVVRHPTFVRGTKPRP